MLFATIATYVEFLNLIVKLSFDRFLENALLESGQILRRPETQAWEKWKDFAPEPRLAVGFYRKGGLKAKVTFDHFQSPDKMHVVIEGTVSLKPLFAPLNEAQTNVHLGNVNLEYGNVHHALIAFQRAQTILEADCAQHNKYKYTP